MPLPTGQTAAVPASVYRWIDRPCLRCGHTYGEHSIQSAHLCVVQSCACRGFCAPTLADKYVVK